MDLVGVDLQFMTNSTYRDKTESSLMSSSLPYTTKDIKFYKKRILHVFREMVKQPENLNTLPLSLQQSFHHCIHQYIEHFKQLDTNDALQSELDISNNNMNTSTNQVKREIKYEPIQNVNTFLYAKETESKKHKTMKDFCIQKKKRKQKPVYPKQKHISLHDKKYKHKGLPTSSKKKMMLQRKNTLAKKEII